MAEREKLEERIRLLEDQAQRYLASQRPATVSEQPAKPGRTELGRIVRLHVDQLREKLYNIVDALAEGGIVAKAALIDAREETALLESALKQWDALPPTEDTCEDLEWRKSLRELATLLADMCSSEADACFPECGFAKRYKRRKEITVIQNLKDSPQQQKLNDFLTTLVGNKESKFTYVWDWDRNSITCLWRSLMKVTISFRPREITKVVVVADGESSSSASSKFDVFRELERQAKQALQGVWTTSTVKDIFDMLIYLIRWFDLRRNLFTLQCSSTKMHLAFGAVGERGKLEARPPMSRIRADDGAEIKVGFGDGLL